MIVWMLCDCYVWPIFLGNGMGRCGYCGVKPHTHVDEPIGGRARPRDLA